MAGNDTQYSTAALDVVAVLNSDFVQVFPEARPLSATVREESKVMEHPLETGSTVVDHRIITPKEIELSCILSSEEYADVYQVIKNIWLNGDTLTVQTRTDSYENMIIESIPHEEKSDMMDGITLAMKLREVKYVTPEFTERKIPVVAAPKNNKTTNRGEQRPQETPQPKKSSLLSKFGLVK